MRTCLLFLLTVFAVPAQGQQGRRVVGIVRDERGEPLESVTIKAIGEKQAVKTEKNGGYTLTIANSLNITLVYSMTGYQAKSSSVQFGGEVVIQRDIVLLRDVRALDEIRVQSATTRPGGVNLSGMNDFPSVSGNFEAVLKTLPGVSANNELSSQYSVRGGNFDENLVYINDVEIYRPLLVRNGQQEGLSIVNPDLSGSINFYPGGYEAKYGDKLSSVLTVRYARPDTALLQVTTALTGSAFSIRHPSRDGKGFYLAGLRAKTNAGVLSSQTIKGTYRPQFYDGQVFVSRDLTSKWTVSALGGYNFNYFSLAPLNRETDFGTSQRYLRLHVDYDGKEADRYRTFIGATTVLFKPTERFNVKWINSLSISNESEFFDLTGRYRLEELQKRPHPEAETLGIGSYRSFADNNLRVRIYGSEFRAYLQRRKAFWEGGIRVERDLISDQLRENNVVDSAGTLLPPGDGDYIHSDINMRSFRFNAFLQSAYQLGSGVSLSTGLRTSYSSLTREQLWSPRISLLYHFPRHDDVTLRVSSGWYNQPPFYRELRNFDGTLAVDRKAQRSFHVLTGADYVFERFGSTLTFSSEVYYKRLSRMVPYKIDNLRIRYLADQQSHGYAAGADFNLSGQFVHGLESVFRLSFLKTAEDIEGDFYTTRNAIGTITRVEPGYLRRPTDQRLNFSVFFQDKLQQNPAYRVHLTLLYGSALPVGPPGRNRYDDVYKIPAYRRVDIGFSKDFLDKEAKNRPVFLQKYFRSFTAFVEVFNLLNINNTISYLWIKDVNNTSYAIPNYLTARQLNLKLVAVIKP